MGQLGPYSRPFQTFTLYTTKFCHMCINGLILLYTHVYILENKSYSFKFMFIRQVWWHYYLILNTSNTITKYQLKVQGKTIYVYENWYYPLIIIEAISKLIHYNDVIMSTMASQVISLTIVYPTVNLGADKKTHQSSASLAFVRGIYQWPVNFWRKGPVAWKIFPFDDVMMS